MVSCATAGGAAAVGRESWTATTPPGFEGTMHRNSHLVYAAALRAFRANGLFIDETDDRERYVVGHAHASFLSWGEIVSVYLRPIDSANTLIRIDSRPRLATNELAHDHTDAIVAAMVAVLSSPSPSASAAP
jgi:hypothetical protein